MAAQTGGGDSAPRWRTVTALGTAQTLSWASTYYLPGVLATPMARELGVAVPTVHLAFSLALIVSALVGPAAGRAIDRHGGRPVLLGTNVLFAMALTALASAQGPWGLFAAWVLIGLGMGSGLYEAAFASLVRLYGHDSRNAITGITLIAGFASTVGWPLSAWMETQWGWRGACLGWAALHLLLGMPLNLIVPRARRASALPSPDPGPVAPVPSPAPDTATVAVATTAGTAETMSRTPGELRTAVLLSAVFALVWFISTSMATHLPALLQAGGATLATAVAVGALVGPAQVAGRLLEFGLLRRIHPLLSARLAGLAHPVGVLVLMALGGPGAAAFALLHGAGNGIMTIAKGTLPLVLFGPLGYGARQGWMMMPARVAQALAPVLFGVALQHWGLQAMWISATLGLMAFAALMAIRAPRMT
ncbi:MAG: MFS transporter [Betaproteobacteria bacterium]